MVPTTISILLALFPAILMALAVVREKELGSITNLYVTPVTRLEFLIGKQIPYVAVAVMNFLVLFLMALFVFQVPLRGSFPALLLGVVIYVTTTTAYGMLISSFASTQIAALFGTAIMTFLPASQFSGMQVPVSSLAPLAQIMGRAFPMTYFRPVAIGTFTKGTRFRRSDRQHRGALDLYSRATATQPLAAPQAGALASMYTIANIFWLGTKELRSFLRDYVLVAFVVYAFSVQVMAQANSYSQEVHGAAVGLVDEDHSELSRRIGRAFLPPYFKPTQPIAEREIVPLMNLGEYTFVIDIPPNFQRDVLGGRNPAIQLDVDATVMVQGGLGAGYAQEIITKEIADFLSRRGGDAAISGEFRRSRRLQPQRDDGMVHERYGHHQQRHHAGDYSRRRRYCARAGARHDGSSSSDAGDAVRDCDVEGIC